MGTKVLIDADITEVNGAPKYRLYARCSARGSLPDTGIFLLEIVDPDVPDDDLLYRVVQVSDIEGGTAFGLSRDLAVRDGVSYWRSAQFANYYTDVEVAANAKQVLQDEINSLVGDYTTYSTQFEATSEEVNFPSTASGAVDSLKNAYDAALTSYNTALTAQEAANEAVTDAETDRDDIETWLARKTQLESDLADRTQEITEAKTRFTAFLGTPPGSASDAAWIIARIEEFISAYDDHGSGVGTERDALEVDKNDFSAQRQTAKSVDVDSTITRGVTNHTNMQLNVSAYIPYTAADLTAANDTLTSAQTAKVAADADVSAKYTILEASYDAVKAVCPDWTPDTPLPPEP